MEVRSVTVEEVREAQESFKTGMTYHESKDFSEAMDAFKKSASIHPFDEKHLGELELKLKAGGFKKQQESEAYLGCAVVHLEKLIQELSDDQKTDVPVDEKLMEIFKGWG